MKKWTDFLNEEPSEKHAADVLRAVSKELETNRLQSPERRWFSWNLAGGLGLCAVAVAGFGHMIYNAVDTYRAATDENREHADTMVALSTLERASDFDVVDDLDLLQNLEDLEKWNGVDV